MSLAQEIKTAIQIAIGKKKAALHEPIFSGNEQKYVKQAFDSNWVAPLGPNVNDFERDSQGGRPRVVRVDPKRNNALQR